MSNNTLNATQPIPSATWGEAFLAAMPFLAWGIATVRWEKLHTLWLAWIGAVCLIFLFFCYGWGWIKEFPRWWFAFPGLLAIISAWMTSMPVNIRFPFHNAYGLLGLWAWLPLVLITIALLIIHPESLGQLMRNIWRDWTLLSFALYGALAWLFWAFFDENMSPLVPICLTATELLLATGAVAYTRAVRASSRLLSLLAGMTLAFLPVTFVNAIYWNGLQAPWMGYPRAWTEVALSMLRELGVLALFLLVPALIALARLVISPLRPK